jgi:hypothetical protein
MHRSTIHSLREPFKALVSKSLPYPTASLHTTATPSLSLTGARPSPSDIASLPRTGLCSYFLHTSATRVRAKRVPSCTARPLRAFSITHSCRDSLKKPLDRDGELDQDLDFSGDQTLGRKGGFKAGSGGTRKLTSVLPTKVKMTLDTPGILEDFSFCQCNLAIALWSRDND